MRDNSQTIEPVVVETAAHVFNQLPKGCQCMVCRAARMASIVQSMTTHQYQAHEVKKVEADFRKELGF